MQREKLELRNSNNDVVWSGFSGAIYGAMSYINKHRNELLCCYKGDKLIDHYAFNFIDKKVEACTLVNSENKYRIL